MFPVSVSRRKALSTPLKFMNYISRTNKKKYGTILEGDGRGGGELRFLLKYYAKG